MVSQSSKGAGGASSASGSGNPSSNTSNSRPNASSSKPRAQGGISFVAFDAGINKETRRAVRVQAAKASAGARKATIARKLAARKRDEDEAENVVNATSRESHPARLDLSKQVSRVERTPLPPQAQAQQHVFAALPSAQPLAVQSPSTASSRSSYKGNSDTESEVTRRSHPSTPNIRHAHTGEFSSTRSRSPARPCNCDDCRDITPASSPDSLDNFEPGAGDQIETMRAIARYAVPRPARISAGRHDPFNCYPVQWQPWFDGLLHYMMTVFAPRAWPVLSITSQQGTKWEWFMTQHAMEEPALFYVRLLFASGDLIRIGALNSECSFWLQSQAIKAINEALRDPKRSVCDGLILAVGRIALHECMYGDRNAANTVHRPAQRRMIDMRGGMTKLGFPDLVKRLMRWADKVMSMQGNTPRLLPDEEDEGNSTYGLKQSVDGFEAWAPGTGQALRKKMAIANLLTD